MYCPKAGLIKAVYAFFYQTAGTGTQTSSLMLMKNGVDQVSVGTGLHNATTTLYSKTDYTISVAQGDYIEFRWNVGAMTTPPTNMTADINVYIQ